MPMKSLFYTLSISLIFALNISSLFAQQDCANGRYFDEIFTGVSVTSNIQYGSSISVDNNQVNLLLDVYQPQGDNNTNRPLILLAHGGSFIGGSKTDDAAIVELCQRFAKMGYVTASMNYRLESALNVLLSSDREKTFLEIIYRAVQDQKAAIRFFRKSVAEQGNPYGINPNIIIVGGSSAGGVLSIHTAYLDKPSEVPSKIDTAALGSMEGASGNPGYSSIPQAVVNLCGAIGDTSWLEAGNQPLVSVHGDVDATVPCYADTAMPLGLPISLVYGSIPLHERAANIGLTHNVKIYWGQDHVPYQSNTAYMDTTVNVVKTFLHNLVCNTSLQTETVDNKSVLSMFPNPASEFVNIQFSKPVTTGSIEVLDLSGKMISIFNIQNVAETMQINLSSMQLQSGYYFIKINTESGTEVLKLNVIK